MSRPELAVIFGPTGVGKSRAALEMAAKYDGEIISADSMQVYRMLDIGTAKPSQEDRDRVRHHLIDLVNPDEDFDAARFVRYAMAALEDIGRRKKRTIVVGGTGLYFRALLGGLFACPRKDLGLRQRLQEEGEKRGSLALHCKLAEVDQESAAKVQPQDLYRIVRALEVFHLTGRPLSAHHEEHGFPVQDFRVLKVGLNLDRSLLYKRIERRAEEMFEKGLVEEVRNLLERGYPPNIRAFRTVTYRPVVNYLQGKLSFEEALTKVKTGTKRYAKRQMTWFRPEKDTIWIDVGWPGWEQALAKELTQFWEDER